MFSQHSPARFIELFPDTMTYLKAAGGLLGITDRGKYELYMTGPGYPFFLGFFAYIIGRAYWLMILIQIIISSISCVIIYMTAILLTKNRIISVIAGLLAAVSLTSISLASAALTETLFFFLFISMLYLFLKGLSENRWWYFVVLLIIFALLYPFTGIASHHKNKYRKIVVAILLFVLLPAVWVIRNTAAYNTPTVSGTGVSAAKIFLTGKVIHKSQNRSPYEFRQFRDSIV